jgi:hypothetical protein
VLFDEAHRNTHLAGGTYKPFVDLIGNDGYKVITNKQIFSKESLMNGDILVIANARTPQGQKNPSAFSLAECEVVRDWVRDGGAVLLIFDSAPFNWESKELANRFGVEVSPGHAIDKTNYNKEGEDQTEIVFSRENGMLGTHPISTGRDPSEQLSKIITFTGTSIKGPDGSSSILKLGESSFDVLRPDAKPITKEGQEADYTLAPAAGRSQAIALEFGKGRVVILGESAVLTAQIGPQDFRYGMNNSGTDNRQLALNIMHWLSRLLN